MKVGGMPGVPPVESPSGSVDESARVAAHAASCRFRAPFRGLEAAILRKMVAEKAHASQERLNALSAEVEKIKSVTQGPIARLDDEIKELGRQIGELAEPAISYLYTWKEQTVKAAPVDQEFAEMLCARILKVKGMATTTPLDDLLKYADQIETEVYEWRFEGAKRKPMLPSLNIDAVYQ